MQQLNADEEPNRNQQILCCQSTILVLHHSCTLMAAGGKEVVVTRKTGEAMMKGADLYAPGVLACSAGISAGDLVAVSIALDEDGR